MGKKKHTTNEEFVRELMNFSNSGAMAQMFIMHAIETVAKQTAEMPLEKIREWDMPFINAEAWHATAKEIKTKFEERYAHA